MMSKKIEIENFQSGYCVTFYADNVFMGNVFGDRVEESQTGSIQTVTVYEGLRTVAIMMADKVIRYDRN